MRLTSTGLGIGVSSPNYSLTSYKTGAVANYLQVTSGATGAGSGNGLLMGVDASGNSVINAQGAINLYTYVAGVLRTTIDSSGNLGLGVTPNTWTSGWRAFEIATSGSSVFSNGASSIAIGQGFYNNSGSKYAQSSYAVGGYQINAGVHSWLIAGLGTAGNAVSFTQAMTLDASGNLGIGTSSPGYKLTVSGGATSLAANQYLRFGAAPFAAGDGSLTNYLFSGSTSMTWRNAADSSDLMYLSNSGNLGLGVTPSAWGSSFRAYQNGGATGALNFSGSNASGLVSVNAYNNGTSWLYQNNGVASRLDYNYTAGGAWAWNIAASGTAGNAITFTQAMTLDASGNLGVGTTSPSSYGLLVAKKDQTADTAITVSNQGTSNAATSMSFVLSEAGTPQGWFRRYRDGSANTEVGFSNALLFTGDVTGTKAERARIDSSGNFHIGTAIADAGLLNINGVGGTSAPTSLYIQTSASSTTDYALRIYNSGTTALFTIRTDGVVNTGAATNSPVNLTTANAANVYIGGASGTLYKSTSSRKYKRDIENTPRGLVDLLKLRAVIYKQKTADVDGNIPDTVHGGLIAEEVHDAGLTEFVQYADDGTPDALAYGHMVSLCVKAIQEQQALIQQLTARVAQLESN